jgi:hypothetical protein|tara:strand:+ start:176 stop:496 length:321 start_codon:yes stop_codon:yes gene_type:complete
MFTTLFQRILIGLGIVVALGILVHDTKFDKAFALALPAVTAAIGAGSHAFDFSGHAHTHVERASLSHAFATIPRAQPRDDYRKYNLEKYFGRNSYFGSSGVIWPHA